MKDYEQIFYAHLGLLSVQFSKMEYNLQVIVSELFGTDEELIAVTVTEKNNLTQNIELLLKLNRLKDYKDKQITDIVSDINKIQSKRNLFIHGIWKDVRKDGDKIDMVCEERKIKYTEQKNKSGKVTHRQWSANRHHVFELTEIKELIDIIDKILVKQTKLIEEMKSEN